MNFRRKIVKWGSKARYFGLTIPAPIVAALGAEHGCELNLELVKTKQGKQVLLVYGDD